MERRNEVLVGVDGSEASTAALIWAAHEAGSRRCGLGIVHAADPAYYGLWTTTELVREGLRDVSRPIVDAAREVARQAEPAVPVYTSVLIGSAARLLVSLSRRVDLVVVGRSGRGALSRLLLGSVPQRLMANAHCPVVAVGWNPQTSSDEPLTRVVAAVGNAEQQAETLEFAVVTAARRNVPVRVLHAISPQSSAVDERRRLDASLAPWRDRYPGVDVRAAVHAGSLHEAITTGCAPGDLLMVGHHRPTPFLPHSVGRHTKIVLDAAPCPVVVVHEVPAAATAHPPVRATARLERSLA